MDRKLTGRMYVCIIALLAIDRFIHVIFLSPLIYSSLHLRLCLREVPYIYDSFIHSISHSFIRLLLFVVVVLLLDSMEK